jgi:hypothetical protein
MRTLGPSAIVRCKVPEYTRETPVKKRATNPSVETRFRGVSGVDCYEGIAVTRICRLVKQMASS